MTESLVSLRLPAVVWLASTAIVLTDPLPGSPGPLVTWVAWVVFLGGIAFFFAWIWKRTR